MAVKIGTFTHLSKQKPVKQCNIDNKYSKCVFSEKNLNILKLN